MRCLSSSSDAEYYIKSHHGSHKTDKLTNSVIQRWVIDEQCAYGVVVNSGSICGAIAVLPPVFGLVVFCDVGVFFLNESERGETQVKSRCIIVVMAP